MMPTTSSVHVLTTDETRGMLPMLAQTQVELFADPPWNLRWYVGSEDDPRSALGFHTWALRQGATYLVANVDDTFAGFAVGAVLTEEMIETLDLAQFGVAEHDYYFLVACVCKAHRKNGVYDDLVRRRLQLAEASGANTLWVRTHVGARTVLNEYRSLGFDERDRYETVDYGEVVVPRIVLSRTSTRHS